MSLDITLISSSPVEKRGTGVYVREGGRNVELTVAEVKERWPDSDIDEQRWVTDEVFSVNITHNLNKMAGEAGIYEAMWRPDEVGHTIARHVIVPLSLGLVRLLDEPDRFRAFNPENGWGDYDGLVETVTSYLAACVEHPDATIEISR